MILCKQFTWMLITRGKDFPHHYNRNIETASVYTLILKIILKPQTLEAGERIQQLRASAVLSGDLPGFSSQHPHGSFQPLELPLQGAVTLFWPPWALDTSVALIYIQAKHSYP